MTASLHNLIDWVSQFISEDNSLTVIGSNEFMYPRRDIVVLICRQANYPGSAPHSDPQQTSSKILQENIWYLHQLNDGPQTLKCTLSQGDYLVRVTATVNPEVKVDFQDYYEPSCSAIPVAISFEFATQGKTPISSDIMTISMSDQHLEISQPKSDWKRDILKIKHQQAVRSIRANRFANAKHARVN
jgi:hypothetical protein